MKAMQIKGEKFSWHLETSNNLEKLYAIDTDVDYKVGCMTLQCGILKCYPIVDDDTIWSDNLCFMCLDDCNVKRFANVPKNVMQEMIAKSEEAISKYYEELDANNADTYESEDIIDNDDDFDESI